jgi:hypothetical protein
MKDPLVPTNRDHSKWAMVALRAFAKVTRMEPLEHNLYECISDLVANLGHLAEQNGRTTGYNAFAVYKDGIGKFSAENRYPDDDPFMDDAVKITVTRGPTEDEWNADRLKR